MNGPTPLVDHYRTLFRGGPRSEAGVETIDAGEVDLSSGAIDERVDESDAQLRRIIREYLGDKPELYEIADRIKASGGLALRLVGDRDERSLRANPEALAQLETIVVTDGSRPSFLVKKNKIDRASSPVGTWEVVLDDREHALEQALGCVGRIDVPDEPQGFAGTGFLIAENLILTNRHVLQVTAARDAQKVWRFKNGVQIDFGHEFRGDERVRPRALRSVAYCGPEPISSNGPIDHSKLDLALIELEPSIAENRPPAVLAFDVARDWPNPELTTFIVGYPASPDFGIYPPTLLEQLFKSLFGYKRMAPGIVIKPKAAVQPWTFGHDATTLGGNSGSVVLVIGREGNAAGLHYGGRRGEARENWGHILGLTLDTREKPDGKTLGEILKAHGVRLVDGPTGQPE